MTPRWVNKYQLFHDYHQALHMTGRGADELEKVWPDAEVRAVLGRYVRAIDAIYNHNEEARAAVVTHFGLHHEMDVLQALGQADTKEEHE